MFCFCGGVICNDGQPPDQVFTFTRVKRVYRCKGPCGRLVPWCFGAADDQPDFCDYCWAKLHGHECAA